MWPPIRTKRSGAPATSRRTVMEEHSRSRAASSMRSEPRSGTHWPNNLRRSLLSSTPLSQSHVGHIETERHIVNRFTKIKIIYQLLDCALKKNMVHTRTISTRAGRFFEIRVWNVPKIETGSVRAGRQDVSRTIGNTSP